MNVKLIDKWCRICGDVKACLHFPDDTIRAVLGEPRRTAKTRKARRR
jgi:hypothetical protein